MRLLSGLGLYKAEPSDYGYSVLIDLEQSHTYQADVSPDEKTYQYSYPKHMKASFASLLIEYEHFSETLSLGKVMLLYVSLRKKCESWKK